MTASQDELRIEAIRARDDVRASFEVYRFNVQIARQEMLMLASASQKAVAISRRLLHRLQPN